MPRHSWISRFLQVPIITCVFTILCIIGVVQLFVSYGEYNYVHIPIDSIHTELYRKVAIDLPLRKGKPDCTYELIYSTKSVNTWEVPSKYDDFSPNGIVNGSYVPLECNPLFSVALVVTYRDRQPQMDVFLPYMHNFLRKQNIHYKIYVVEQIDEGPFNKGALYNIGVKHAIADKFPCVILHDVDLLPLDEANLYACTTQPRHLSASIDKFRFVLIYDFLVGGVLAITTDHYTLLNGFSNRFLGWGGEDDDLAARITKYGLRIDRFPRRMSRYTMMKHHQETKNRVRTTIMAQNKQHGAVEGLSTVRYRSMRVSNHRLFTLLALHL